MKIKFEKIDNDVPSVRIFKFDEDLFNSLSSFVTKFRSMNLDLKIAEDQLQIWWTDPQGDEILIRNDQSLQMALEISRNLYASTLIRIHHYPLNPWTIELPSLTKLYKGYDPIFTLRVVYENNYLPK